MTLCCGCFSVANRHTLCTEPVQMGFLLELLDIALISYIICLVHLQSPFQITARQQQVRLSVEAQLPKSQTAAGSQHVRWFSV